MRRGAVQNLRLKRVLAGKAQPGPSAMPGQKLSSNAMIGMGLWILLWLGYNAGPEYVLDPNFPASLTELIHGIRAFFPMLAGWLAVLVLYSRSNRVFPWLLGPLGLMLIYALTGMVSTWLSLPEPLIPMYYGANYLAIVLVLLAIVSVPDPLSDLRKVLQTTWVIGIILTMSLLGAIPVLGSQVVVEADNTPVGLRAYNGLGTIMGMSSSRNTGFARYAAISALVALPGLMRKGHPAIRALWGVLFLASCYALVIANGRTEILAFIGGMVILLVANKSKRTTNLLIAAAAAILLGFEGFYSAFFLYFTRTGHLDLTMTGRTDTWRDGLRIFTGSPLVGLGFQSDRYYLRIHMHNAFLHVLFQSGILGGGAILIGIAIVWFYLIKYFFLHKPADESLIPPEIPAVFLFVTISSITESTFAYFSAAWLLSAPIVAYVIALDRHMRMISAKATQDRVRRILAARLAFRSHAPSGG
jgi:hypothetical protein